MFQKVFEMEKEHYGSKELKSELSVNPDDEDVFVLYDGEGNKKA